MADNTKMIDLTEKTTRIAAAEYLKSSLRQGKTLSEFLLQTIDPGTGAIYVLSPDRLEEPDIAEFDCGHFITSIPGPIADSNNELAEFLQAPLKSKEDICLLENSVASASDPWLKRAKSHIVSHETDVYHILLGGEDTKRNISYAIREAHQIPLFLGAVGRLPTDVSTSILTHKAITREILRGFAETAHCFFAGAYDGEGYIVWEKKSTAA